MDNFVQELVNLNPAVVELHAQSPHERLNAGLMINSAIHPIHEVAEAALREIAHVHPADHSLHVMLAPQDCKFGASSVCSCPNVLINWTAVIERGWGERHQLSGSPGLHTMPLPAAMRPARLPKEYIWIYAPRDLQELAVVKNVLVAGVKYMTGHKDIVVPQ